MVSTGSCFRDSLAELGQARKASSRQQAAHTGQGGETREASVWHLAAGSHASLAQPPAPLTGLLGAALPDSEQSSEARNRTRDSDCSPQQ